MRGWMRSITSAFDVLTSSKLVDALDLSKEYPWSCPIRRRQAVSIPVRRRTDL